MGRIATYDSEEVNGSLGGITLGKDMPAKGTWKIKPEGPSWGDEAGANGDVLRYPTHERRMTVTLTVMGSSTDNQKLSALHNSDENNPSGAGVGAFLLKDSNGATLYSGQGWIMGLPDNALGQTRDDVEWTIRVFRQKGTAVVGGN